MDEKKRRLEIEEESGKGGEDSPETTENPGEDVPELETSDEEVAEAEARAADAEKEAEVAPQGEQLRELNDKYLRLYAEYENYRKKAAKDREELAKYIREEIMYEILPSLDHLEIALKHASEEEGSGGLGQGVEMTLRELLRTLEKFGLKPIEAKGKPFDPQYHHAISQVETDEAEDKTVLEEFRKGYMYGDKVLRASMVSVARKPGSEN